MSEPFEGIVIRLFASREADLVLKVLVRGHGKLAMLARSARKSKKRFAAPFDLFDRGTFHCTPGRSSLLLIENFAPEKPFRAIRSNLTKITSASILCDVADHLTHEGLHEEEDLFVATSLALDAIDQAASDREALRACHIGVASIVRLTGFGAELIELPPSLHNLSKLLNFVEECSERKLQSKSALQGIVETLPKAV